MKNISFVLISILLVVSVVALFATLSAAESQMQNAQATYYRGVFEACVWSSVVEGKTTSFDVLACSELEQRARREHWYDHPVIAE